MSARVLILDDERTALMALRLRRLSLPAGVFIDYPTVFFNKVTGTSHAIFGFGGLGLSCDLLRSAMSTAAAAEDLVIAASRLAGDWAISPDLQNARKGVYGRI